MGNTMIRSYKGVMNRSAAFGRAIAAIGVPARALLFVSALGCALSCTDGDASHSPPGSEGGGAPMAGQGGSSGAAAGQGSPEAGQGGTPEQAAGEGGMAGSGDSDAGGGAGGPTQGVCFADTDCNDGLYCNGVELCKARSPDSDLKVCMGP